MPPPATIRAPTQGGGDRRAQGVRSAREQDRLVARSGFDVLIVSARSRPSSRSRFGRRRRCTADDPVVRLPAAAVILLGLLARRRFPFGAPAAFWLLAAAARSSTAGWSYSPSAAIAGMLAAVLLGNLRDVVLAASGSRDRRRRGAIVDNDPATRTRRARVHPGPLRDRLARRLRAPRARRAGRGSRGAGGTGRAGARDRRAASPSRRSGRGSRASSTTSSPTPSA